MSKYVEQGRQARRSGQSRDSCRFKAADIVRDWQAGWDEVDALAKRRAAEEVRFQATLRWVDVTSYSQGEIGRKVEPRTWELRSTLLGGNDLTVTRYFGLSGWRIESRRLRGYKEIESVDAEQAKAEALRLFNDWLGDAQEELVTAAQALAKATPEIANR